MYGLVNNGVRAFIVENHGEAVWKTICTNAGVTDEEFENLTAYDDDTTYALVGAVCKTLDLPVETVLEVFGEYWVGFSKATAIGRLIDLGRETLIERIRGLDEMHERVQLTMPHLKPPSFDFEEMPDGAHRLHYFSVREGLAPMVVGLLQGMARECGVGIDVTLSNSRADGHDHDVFTVRIGQKAASAA